MLVELGPSAADVVLSWTKCARRVSLELTSGGDLVLSGADTGDWFKYWSGLLDSWSDAAVETQVFVWAEDIDAEVAGFVVHGMERLLRCPLLPSCVTRQEIDTQAPFTIHVLRSFLNALSAEGPAFKHHAEEVRGLLSSNRLFDGDAVFG